MAPRASSSSMSGLMGGGGGIIGGPQGIMGGQAGGTGPLDRLLPPILKPGIGGGPWGNAGRLGGNTGGGSLGDLYFGGLLCALRL